MTLGEFIVLRKTLGMTQAEFGDAIGLSVRSVSEIENGSTKLRLLHELAAERVALAAAASSDQPIMAPFSVRRDALALSRIIRGEPKPEREK